MTPELTALLASFKPKFGDDDSIYIVGLVEKLRRAEDAVTKNSVSVRRLEKVSEKKTQAEQDVERFQEALRFAITEWQKKQGALSPV